MKLLGRRPTGAAQELFAVACHEADRLSFGVGVEHLLLACAVLSPTLETFGADAEEIRDRIRARERDALASLGNLRASFVCGAGLPPTGSGMNQPSSFGDSGLAMSISRNPPPNQTVTEIGLSLRNDVPSIVKLVK